MDPTKLYVANIPAETTHEALRRHFAACGGVLQVDMPEDHPRGKLRGLACVTMTTAAYATAARTQLDGVSFAGAVLRVSDAPEVGGKPRPTVTIKQQFREPTNMAYDLDCAGQPLVVRIFPEDQGKNWRLEARATDGLEAAVVTARATTRAAALAEVIRSWNATAASTAGRTLDGDALTTALRDVRAV